MANFNQNIPKNLSCDIREISLSEDSPKKINNAELYKTLINGSGVLQVKISDTESCKSTDEIKTLNPSTINLYDDYGILDFWEDPVIGFRPSLFFKSTFYNLFKDEKWCFYSIEEQEHIFNEAPLPFSYDANGAATVDFKDYVINCSVSDDANIAHIKGNGTLVFYQTKHIQCPYASELQGKTEHFSLVKLKVVEYEDDYVKCTYNIQETEIIGDTTSTQVTQEL